MLDDIKDVNTEILHVIITSSHDTCSEASLNDLIDFNLVLKKTSTNFRAVCMNYKAKENK